MNIVTKGDFVNLLVKCLKDYRKEEPLKSILRNRHMNEITVRDMAYTDMKMVDAILVDFVNYVAAWQGLDLGLYTKDIATETNA
jgi:hypothetical protein